MAKSGKDVADFGDLYDDIPSTKSLRDLVGQTFVMTDVEYLMGGFGEMAVITIDGEKYRTSSKVLLRQTRAVEEHIKQGGVKATLYEEVGSKGGKYLTFAPKRTA